MSFQRFLLSEMKKINANRLMWVFPLTAGFTWLIWDALDEEWLVSLKLAPDPEALNKRVESERLARLEALKKPKPAMLKGPTIKESKVEEDEPEEEEEAPAEDKEDPPSEEEEEEAPAGEDNDDVPAGEDGDDAAEDEEEEEEESEVVFKPLYDPIKGKKLGKKDLWDNFTIKALNMGEDDDDDEEEEEEGTYIVCIFYSLLDTYRYN